MLPEYINWKCVQKYQVTSDTVEAEKWWGGTKWKVSAAIKIFLNIFNRHRISQINVVLHTKKILEYCCFH